ncbi:MAG TPA: hypothetical protein DEH78_19990 [Solibacterales bacterium]|nr:hypothetical protein [Bryobacterales bacterium]
MKLNDLRKLAARDRVRIRFALSNGLQCVFTEQGLSRIEGLDAPPGFNLETELANSAQFIIERPPGASKQVSRTEVEKMAASLSGTPQHHDREE